MTYEEAAEWLKSRGLTATWSQDAQGQWQCEIAPGDTPPAESSMSGASDRQPGTGSTRSNWVAYAVIGAFVVVLLLFFVGYVIGLFD